jgi:hypothetical protein
MGQWFASRLWITILVTRYCLIELMREGLNLNVLFPSLFPGFDRPSG